MIRNRIGKLERTVKPSRKVVVAPAEADFDAVVSGHFEPGVTVED